MTAARTRRTYPISALLLLIMIAWVVRAGASTAQLAALLTGYAVSWCCADRVTGAAGTFAAMALGILAGAAVFLLAAAL